MPTTHPAVVITIALLACFTWGAGQAAGNSIVVKVTDFGAQGDDQADDTEALLAAIAALPPVPTGEAGAVLYFPPGKYYLSQPLSFPSGTRVFGPGDDLGRGAWLHNMPDYHGPLVRFVGDVENIYFRLWVSNQWGDGIVQEGGRMRNCYFEGFRVFGGLAGSSSQPHPDTEGACGFRASDLENCTFAHIWFRGGTNGHGFRVEGRMDHVAVIRCHFEGDTTASALFLAVPGSGRSLFLGNTPHFTSGSSIHVVGGEDITFRQTNAENSSQKGQVPVVNIEQARHLALQVQEAHCKFEPPYGVVLNGDHNILQCLANKLEHPPTSGYQFLSDDPCLIAENLHAGREEAGGLDLRGPALGRMLSFIDVPGLRTDLQVWHQGQSLDFPLAAEQARPGAVPVPRAFDMVIPPPPELGVPMEEIAALGGFEDIRDYGAKPGQDATSAILAAVEAADAEGGSGQIFLPPGTWLVTSPLELKLAEGRISIFGAGRERTILQAAAELQGPVLQLDNAIVRFQDFTIRGGDYGVLTSSTGRDAGFYVARVRFADQRIAGWRQTWIDNGNLFMDCLWEGGRDGFVIVESENFGWLDKVLFLRCEFRGQERYGVYLDKLPGPARGFYLGHVIWRDCVFRNCGSSGAFLGRGMNGYELVLDKCRFENCGQQDAAPYLDTSLIYSLVIGCHFYRSTGPRPEALMALNGLYDNVQWCRFEDATDQKAAALLVRGGKAIILRGLYANSDLLIGEKCESLLAQNCVWNGGSADEQRVALAKFSEGNWENLMAP